MEQVATVRPKQQFRTPRHTGVYSNISPRGNLKLATKDLTGAKTAYEMALQIDPSFAAGHYNLGMILKIQGYFKDAIVAYQQAIVLNLTYVEQYSGQFFKRFYKAFRAYASRIDLFFQI